MGEPVTPLDLADVDSFDAETDVFVAGFGAAGCCVAHAAREAGDHAARLQVVQPVPFREETLSSGAEAQMFVRTLWPD